MNFPRKNKNNILQVLLVYTDKLTKL